MSLAIRGVLIVTDNICSSFTLSEEARKHKYCADRLVAVRGENKDVESG